MRSSGPDQTTCNGKLNGPFLIYPKNNKAFFSKVQLGIYFIKKIVSRGAKQLICGNKSVHKNTGMKTLHYDKNTYD